MQTLRSAIVALTVVAGCGPVADSTVPPGKTCGPTEGIVSRVIDGDTIELRDGNKIRYLGVDTPESTTKTECYGKEARSFNDKLVYGRKVTLEYDEVCKDKFNRLLAFVTVDGKRVSFVLLDGGYACRLVVPPNNLYSADLKAAETRAKSNGQGLWGACSKRPC